MVLHTAPSVFTESVIADNKALQRELDSSEQMPGQDVIDTSLSQQLLRLRNREVRGESVPDFEFRTRVTISCIDGAGEEQLAALPGLEAISEAAPGQYTATLDLRHLDDLVTSDSISGVQGPGPVRPPGSGL